MGGGDIGVGVPGETGPHKSHLPGISLSGILGETDSPQIVSQFNINTTC